MSATGYYCFAFTKESLYGDYGNIYGLYEGSWIPHIFIDLILLAMPVPLIWKLQMRTTRKLMLTAIFACGVLYVTLLLNQLGSAPGIHLNSARLTDRCSAYSVLIISILRLANVLAPTAGNTIIWSTVEVNASIVCGQYSKTSSFRQQTRDVLT